MEINPQIKKFAEEFEFTYVDMFSQVADLNNYLIKDAIFFEKSYQIICGLSGFFLPLHTDRQMFN